MWIKGTIFAKPFSPDHHSAHPIFLLPPFPVHLVLCPGCSCLPAAWPSPHIPLPSASAVCPPRVMPCQSLPSRSMATHTFLFSTCTAPQGEARGAPCHGERGPWATSNTGERGNCTLRNRSHTPHCSAKTARFWHFFVARKPRFAPFFRPKGYTQLANRVYPIGLHTPTPSFEGVGVCRPKR